MIDQNLKNLLVEAGLESSSTEIYLILAQKGELTVSELIKDTSLSRTTVHSALMDLLVKELVLYRKEGRNAYYKPAHPSGLMRLLEDKKRQQSQFEVSFQEGLGSLAGMFNLANNRPGVRFYEGKEGIKSALFTSLQAKDMIYTFMNIDPILNFSKDLNDEYVAKRKEKNILKKMLVVPTPKAIERYVHTNIASTEFRFLPKTFSAFQTNFQIFDNSILFFTIKEKEMIGFEIMNPDIAGMLKNIFDFIWEASGSTTVPTLSSSNV